MLDNPCKHCTIANIDYVRELEYGCDNPCQKAEEYFSDIGKRIDDLLKRVNELLKDNK